MKKVKKIRLLDSFDGLLFEKYGEAVEVIFCTEEYAAAHKALRRLKKAARECVIAYRIRQEIRQEIENEATN